MTVNDIIARMFPHGMDAFEPFFATSPLLATSQRPDCPTWPPDLFVTAGTIIEQSGCYTQASPDRSDREGYKSLLKRLHAEALQWSEDMLMPPSMVQQRWRELVDTHGAKTVEQFASDSVACRCVLELFAIADEACLGMGWAYDAADTAVTTFAKLALLFMTGEDPSPLLPHLARSLCSKVPPDVAVVLPKSITSSVGCTIRSLSHHLAMLPATTVVEATWNLANDRHLEAGQQRPGDPFDVSLLLIPFPFRVAAQNFTLTSSREPFGAGKHAWPAYFGLKQLWLHTAAGQLTGAVLARELVLPLIAQAESETGAKPHGIVFPECALNQQVASELVDALKGCGVEFLIAGILHEDHGKVFNRACTYVIRPDDNPAIPLVQNKHHRWRLDRNQTDRYALNFDPDPDNSKWWEDIDVSERALPFLGLRKDMSLVTLICEDLARADPAMTAIRAIGPNLVVALLMDGPQLVTRWPGRYAMVLAEDPGSAVLTLTCAGMVDRANWPESRPTRSIGLWRDADGKIQEIGLPEGSGGVLLTLQSKRKHQTTLDLRSDNELSRQLTLRTIVPLPLAAWPAWV